MHSMEHPNPYPEPYPMNIPEFIINWKRRIASSCHPSADDTEQNINDLLEFAASICQVKSLTDLLQQEGQSVRVTHEGTVAVWEMEQGTIFVSIHRLRDLARAVEIHDKGVATARAITSPINAYLILSGDLCAADIKKHYQ